MTTPDQPAQHEADQVQSFQRGDLQGRLVTDIQAIPAYDLGKHERLVAHALAYVVANTPPIPAGMDELRSAVVRLIYTATGRWDGGEPVGTQANTAITAIMDMRAELDRIHDEAETQHTPACSKRGQSGRSCIQQLANGWHGPSDFCPACTVRFVSALDRLGEELAWHPSFVQRAVGGGS
jgi:hypothetical protein